MADFVAFNKEFTITYSIYDALELEKQGINITYYCQCQNPVFIRNESIEFKNKKGTIIQRHAHFCHYKNCNCIIPRIFNKEEKQDSNKTDDAPEKTVLYKRKRIIFKILDVYNKSLKIVNYAKGLLKDCINVAKNNHVDYHSFMNDYIMNILSSQSTLIGFKDIEYSNIGCFNNVIYIINDIEIISNTTLNKICDDFDRYKVYIKNLSLISLYASRCYDFHKIELEVFSYITVIENEINNYKKSRDLSPISLNKEIPKPERKRKKVVI